MGSVVVISVSANATVVRVPGRVVAIRNPDTDNMERLPAPVGEKLEGLERRIAELEQHLTKVEGSKSKNEGIQYPVRAKRGVFTQW